MQNVLFIVRDDTEKSQSPLARILQCAVKGAFSQWVKIPTRQLSLQPVAIGAVVEATKRPKPSV